MKNSSDKSGIEAVTFLLVAQCLNQLRHQQRAPNVLYGTEKWTPNVHTCVYL
jgi:hypothetical protein